MLENEVISDFRQKVSEKIDLIPEGIDRYRVVTPFIFDDGDILVILLRKEGDIWLLSDEGHTFLQLLYDIDERDLDRGTRQKIILNTISTFNVDERDGELYIQIQDGRFGDSLYSFIQALIKITDLSYLARELVRSTFMEDLRIFLEEKVPDPRREFEWHHPEFDPEGKYLVDCKVNSSPKPLYIHAVPNDAYARDATITLLQFEKWNLSFHSLAIFEDMEQINRRVLARYTDVCEKTYSSLSANKDRISNYILRNLF